MIIRRGKQVVYRERPLTFNVRKAMMAYLASMPEIQKSDAGFCYLEKNSGDLRDLVALLGHRSLNSVMIYTEPTFDKLAA